MSAQPLNKNVGGIWCRLCQAKCYQHFIVINFGSRRIVWKAIMSASSADLLATPSGNTLYEILGISRSTSDIERITEGAANLLVDIPFVAEYMEKFTSEQIESWNENWKAHGHHSEESKVQFYEIMHAYAEVLRHARGSAIVQVKRTNDGQDQPSESYALLGITSAASHQQIKMALKKRLLMMCEISHWSLKFPFGLLQCALEYWNADQVKGPSTKEYAQWEQIHVAMETLLTPKRNIYDRIIEVEPAILCQRRTTRRAIFQWRSEVHPAIEQRVQQLQDSEHGNTGPANEDLQAVHDELR